ncbi:MAG TPA: hypothetical protein VFM18_09160 [Methanosarcina sp.]|nr:hypothetical protein [Methanosarcina sp.]
MDKKKLQVVLTYEVEGDIDLVVKDLQDDVTRMKGIPYSCFSGEYQYEMLPEIQIVVESADRAIATIVREKLSSGNHIPVERCTIRREEVAKWLPLNKE